MCLPGRSTVFYLLSLLAVAIMAWPDGAPCIHAVYESLNPLEAVEHQGGLQLTVPPYKIEVREKCYWPNQPVELSLKGNTTADRFRGFAIQPISYKGPNRGRRVGQFLRLDDNGSWQQQCFRFKNSVTHSHDEKKKNIKLWWKNEFNDDDYVQFVATVVKAQKEFWVKSVRSVPIPPCRLERNGIQDYIPDPVTPPPPVKPFKLDTFRMFDAVDSALQYNLLEVVPNDADRTPKPQKIQDFFRVMQISNRQRSRMARPQVPVTQALISEPVTLAPLVPQVASAFVASPPQPQFVHPLPTSPTVPPQTAPAFVSPQQPQPVPWVAGSASTPPPQPLPQPVSATAQMNLHLVDNQVQTPQIPQVVEPVHERQHLTHVIPVSNLASVQQPFAQQISNHAQLQQQQQQQQQQQHVAGLSFRAPPQTPNIGQRIFVRPIQQQQQQQLIFQSLNACVDVDPPALCFSRITFCNTRQYMRINCRRTCRFC